MPITDSLQLHGAAVRGSILRHVISIHHGHRRFQSQKPIIDSNPPPGYVDEQLAQNVFAGDGFTYLGQAGRPAEAPDLEEVGAHGRTTISLTLGLPTFEEAPDVLKSCYVDGILKKPRQFIDYALLSRHTTSEKYQDTRDGVIFRHHLTLKAPGFPEVKVSGKGTSMVRLIRVLFCSVLTSNNTDRR